ncbi:MAG TPA: MBL fold metallo-hydrolase [Sedimentisphaerales bacterium]|nr:MBL fold metallo-hydrolase [Sedimentisphaerales bacterium]
MKIDHLILGAFQTNCYVLRESETAKNCLVIDTGLEAGRLIEFLKEHKLNPVAVVLTHGHADHVAGVTALRESFPDIKTYIHKFDAEMLTEARSNLGLLAGGALRTKPADLLLEEQSIIEEAGIKLQVLHTPGHTPGGICLYSEDEGIVFTDDALFADSVGRTDLGGNMAHLIKSIREKLLTLPDDTAVYPGHGPTTTIAHEKAHNQFLK